MMTMPNRAELREHEMLAYQIAEETVALAPPQVVTSDWQAGLPRLAGNGVTLREVQVSDAPSLFAMLTTEEVARFISPPPTSVEGFERFIEWAQRERSAGQYVCFAIVPAGHDTAVGIMQVRRADPDFLVAEWGFAIGSPFWGTGLFREAATRVLTFTFDVLGVQRLEARAAVVNGRGNGALRKIGAIQECVLRRSFVRRGVAMDQALWAILAEDWRRSKAVWGARKGRLLAFTRTPASPI
jgi:ribosomal-protein-alanine N-acetyltransferase